MNSTLRNILATITGFVIGSIVNMGLVTIGPYVIPFPQGADVSNMEALKESMKLFTPANFIFPFLAHAIGTLVGAFVVVKLAVTHHTKLAMIIGGLFLVGGIMMVKMTGGPLWFIVADLVVAYIPMALLGAKLAQSKN